MTQYIDKAAVVAEITNLKKPYDCGWNCGINKVLEHIDDLEVKDLNIDKEIQDHIRECLDVKFPTTDIELIKKDVAYTAKRFFELGLKAAQKGE